MSTPEPAPQSHFRGLQFIGTANETELKIRLQTLLDQARNDNLPQVQLPTPQQLASPERLVIDYGDTDEFIKRAEKALKAFDSENPAMWQAMTAQGVYRGSGKPGKVAFLFPGQG